MEGINKIFIKQDITGQDNLVNLANQYKADIMLVLLIGELALCIVYLDGQF